MLDKEKIIGALIDKGYKVEKKIITKNGIEQVGYVVKSGRSISPVFYLDTMLEEFSYNDILNFIEEYIQRGNQFFDPLILTNKEYILSHLYIGLQKAGNENLVKKNSIDFEGLEEYLFLMDSVDKEILSIKVTEELLKDAGVDLSTAWFAAFSNVIKDLTITNLSDLVKKWGGPSYEIDMPFYVLSNSKNTKGASAALSKKALLKIANEYKTDKVLVLPSSIHEVIVAPYFEETDVNMYEDMVKTINATVVEPKDKLIDKAYVITVQ